MAKSRRVPAVVFLLALSLAVAAPALAQEEEETEDTQIGTDTTVGEETESTTGLMPAVEVIEEEEVVADPQWTYRYLIPTALALAVVIILVISIRYFSDVVRKRYRVVEE